MSFPFGEMLSHHEESCACSSLVQLFCFLFIYFLVQELFCFDSIWNMLKVCLLKRTTANKALLSGKEEKKHKCTLTSLPDDIMELIMKRLCLKDCLGLHEICTHWRDIVANAIANKHCHPLPELPVLVLFDYTPNIFFQSILYPHWRRMENVMYRIQNVVSVLHSQGSSTVFSLRKESLVYPKRPLFEKMLILGSVEGWMIVSEYCNVGSRSVTIFFFNPLTNARVFVPSVLNFPSNSPLPKKKLIRKMVASSKPDCLDCFLVCLFGDYYHIKFCRLSDKSWTTIEANTKFMDVEIIDTKLYARSTFNSILVWDLQDSSEDTSKPKVLAMLPPRPPSVLIVAGNQRFVRGKVRICLAKDDASGDLFLIYRFYNEYVAPPEMTRVEVFELNTSNETNKWIKVDNMGDRVLFLSRFKCMVMSRAALNSSEELIKENSIYFAFSYPNVGDTSEVIQLGMICLTDNSIKYFTLEKSSPFPFSFWFVPSV